MVTAMLGYSTSYEGGGLLTSPNVPARLKEELKDGTVNTVFSNPPFAGYAKDPVDLGAFKLGKNAKGDIRSVSKEILFVEKIIDLLTEGGKAALVLPSGVFNNSSETYTRLRTLIRENCKITALIALPYSAFAVSGATNEGNLLFFEKMKNPPEDYQIYIDWARYVGFDNTGRKTPDKNDLHEILKRMKNPKSRNLITLSELEREGRYDPWYYFPLYAQLEAALSKSPYGLRPISELITKTKEFFDPDITSSETYSYVETSDVDLDEGKIIGSTQVTAKTAPSRARYVLREGDFLIPNSIHSIRGVAVVSKAEDGFICTNRFIVVRPKSDEVRPNYLFHMLRQTPVLCLLKRQSTGEISQTIPYPALSKVKIPCPDLPKQDRILTEIEKLDTKRNQLMTEIATREQEILSKVGDSLPTTLTTSRRNLARQGYDYIAFL
jgi:type I restriction-modification system DNA methylase subunit